MGGKNMTNEGKTYEDYYKEILDIFKEKAEGESIDLEDFEKMWNM